jgi:hypothetical protein
MIVLITLLLRFFQSRRWISAGLVVLVQVLGGHVHTTFAAGGCSTPSFNSASTYSAGRGPGFIAAGDLNGDGAIDVVVPNSADGVDTFSILFGDGAGGFLPPLATKVGIKDTTVGAYPRAAAIGDLNGDGKPDIVIAGGYANGWVSVLLGDGTGKFGPALDQPTGQGRATDVALGDFNGDGTRDVALAKADSQKILFLLGNGAGGFSTMVAVTANSEPIRIAVGDLNGDGLTDVATTNTYPNWKLTVVLGRSDANFVVNQSITETNNPTSIAIADFNRDGRLDLASGFSHATNGFEIRLGDGSGQFGSPLTTFTEYAPTALAATDVNNDSNPDLLISISGASAVGVYPGLGTGQFMPPKYFSSLNGGVASMVVADFNGDGKKDIVGSNYNAGAISIQTGDGAGAFASAKVLVGTDLRGARIVSADFNGDGRPDIAIPTAYVANVLIYLNDGAGNLLAPTTVPISRPGISIATADFNHDNKADLVVGHDLAGGPSVVSILLGNGSGGFSGPTTFNIDISNEPSKVIIPGNFDGDNNVDLIVMLDTFSNGTNIKLLRGNGTGGFGPPSLVTSTGWTTWIDSGDFNGDGKTDLALANFFPAVVNLLLNDGNASFAASGTSVPIPDKVSYLRVADLNNDGRPDLITAHSEPNLVQAFLNNGSGFNSSQGPTALTAPGAVTVADFNGDTFPDLAINTNVAAGNIEVLTGDGLGNFGAPLFFTSGGYAADILAADFNADGKPDIATPNYPAILMNTFTVLPCLSIDDVSITEGDSGMLTANFSVSISHPSEETVRVNYLTTGVEATGGADFTSVSGRLYFVPSETSKTISVPIAGDVLNESDETFKVLLSNPVAGAIADGEGRGTIIDNDPLPTLSVNDISNPEGGFFTRNFTVTLSAPSGRAVTVQYATANGTATAGTSTNGDDYFNTAGTLTIPAGQTSGTVGINIFGDGTYEPDETFFLNLSNPMNATISDGQGQATIVNDDPVPTVSINDAAVVEGNSGTQTATFDVRLSNPTYLPVTFNYATSDDTAKAGSDYVATSGVFTFNPMETVKTITVPAMGDTVDETGERFFLDLTNPQNASAGRTRAFGFIVDDDGPTISVNDITVLEGNSGTRTATFTLTLSAASPETLSVRVGTAADTATANSDYLAFNATLTIPAGTTTRTFNITINGDTASEPDEVFFANLSNPTNGTIARAQGKCIIISDDNGSGNPIDLPGFFVRQHYLDFLGREPDVSGFEFWRNQITSCGADAQCTEVRRIDVSASFFLSIEFQQSGYLVERFYKVAYGDTTGDSNFASSHQLAVPTVRFNEFLQDTKRVLQGVVVLAPGWEQALETNKQAYALEFVQTTRFTTAFPTMMTPAQFVDQLNQDSGGVLTLSERQTVIDLFGGASNTTNLTTRAQAVRMVAEAQSLYNAEYNRAFVLAEYFGYLRRNPNDAPESTLDYTGYDFWLTKLNQFNGNYINAEMVKAFLSSIEYRQRFGP